MAKTLGLDVGGTNLRLGVFEGLNLVEELRFKADYSAICNSLPPAQAWQNILQTTAEAIEVLFTRYPQIQSIGIGFPGFINPHTGILAQSPNLPGLNNINLGKDLSALVNVKVKVENDANAAAYGEYCLAGRPKEGLIYVGLGTGVGAGLVVNDRLYVGSHGYAMEFGHIIVHPDGPLCGCGNYGCVEQYASATAVKAHYLQRTGIALQSHEIAGLARQGKAEALAVYAQAGDALAQALASALKLIDVKHVMIGGGLIQAWDLMADAFTQRFNHDLIPVLRNQVSVHISQAEDIAGMLGVAVLSSST